MSSLARRSIRTTVAAVGLAAFGVGVAGHALAAPALPLGPQGGAPGEQADAATDGRAAVGDLLGATPVDPDERAAELPGVFHFEAPTVNQSPRDAEGRTTQTVESSTGPTRSQANGLPDVAAAPGVGALPALPLAAPALPAPSVPGAGDLASPDTLGSAADVGGLAGQLPAPDVDAQAPQGQAQVGALPGLDSASMFTDLAGRVASGQPTSDLEVGS